jgi:hypothetical protein
VTLLDREREVGEAEVAEVAEVAEALVTLVFTRMKPPGKNSSCG